MGFQVEVKKKVQNQGVDTATLPLEALGKDPPVSSSFCGPQASLACGGHITAVSASVFTWPSPLRGSVSNSPCLYLVRIHVTALRL